MKKPTPALLLSTAALFISLGGGAYAAGSLAPHSVGARQLKNDAVASITVRDHSLRAQDFAPGQLPAGPKGDTGDTGARGAKGDTGPKGDTGDTGARGAKGDTGAPGAKGDPGVSGTHLVTATDMIGDDLAQGEIAYCNAGETAIGGGGHVGAAGLFDAQLTRSEPWVSNDGKSVGWVVIATNQSGTAQPLVAYAVCATVS